MQENYDAIQARNAEVIPVTTDDLAGYGDQVERVLDPPYPMPYDTSAEVPKQWDRFDNFGTELADAAVFLITKDGDLAWKDVGDNYQHFVPAEDILAELDKLGA